MWSSSYVGQKKWAGAYDKDWEKTTQETVRTREDETERKEEVFVRVGNRKGQRDQSLV